MKTNEICKAEFKQRRENLKALSRTIDVFVKQGMFDNVNEGLMVFDLKRFAALRPLFYTDMFYNI